jgi:hypothetical protein
MCFARKFSDLLLVLTLFSIPFSTFTKWLYPPDLFSGIYQGALIGTFGIGLIDFLLVGLYLSWFYRIIVIRVQTLPRLHLLDGLILCYILTIFLASIGSWAGGSYGGTEFLLKHAIIYFCIASCPGAPFALDARGFAFIIALERAYNISILHGQADRSCADKGAVLPLNRSMRFPAS